jgi:hypothetical protein
LKQMQQRLRQAKGARRHDTLVVAVCSSTLGWQQHCGGGRWHSRFVRNCRVLSYSSSLYHSVSLSSLQRLELHS